MQPTPQSTSDPTPQPLPHATPRSFAEFWPLYVAGHRSATNRQLHFAGTLLSFVFLGAAAVTERPLYLLLAIVAAYALAWTGHFVVEKNRPLSLRHPAWNLLADWRMFYLTLNGKMATELERYAK